MVTLISKSKVMKVYNLNCSIPVRGGKKEDLSKNKKTKAKGVKVQSERVLTMLPKEKRMNLPEAILMSPSIKQAIEKKEILVKRQKAVEPNKEKSEKSFSASSKGKPSKEEKPTASSKTDKK